MDTHMHIRACYSLNFGPQGPLTIVSPLSSLFCVCVRACVFDGKHSDQTVLNRLPELITEGEEEERMREERKGDWGFRWEGKEVKIWGGNVDVCF